MPYSDEHKSAVLLGFGMMLGLTSETENVEDNV